MLTCMYPWVLYIGGACIILYLIIRRLLRRYVTYRMPTTHLFMRYVQEHASYHQWKRYASTLFRVIAIAALLCALARPRQPDEQSAVTIEGRDIVLTLDVSGSMQLIDDLRDKRQRWDVARDEARRFISNRTHDPIGIVYFGAFALSRCPITLDKTLLDDVVKNTRIGDLNPQGTMLSQALALSVQRLRNSVSHNKVIILLTDGSPSSNDLSVDQAISLAKKAGIVVYTIGVGSNEGGYIMDPLVGLQRAKDSANMSLLEYISRETGGKSFHANNPQEVRAVYDAIDALETSEHDAPEYHRYYEYFMPCLWIALLSLFAELWITTWIWVTL